MSQLEMPSTDITVFEDSGNERAVLACISNIPDSIIEIHDIIKDSDFVTPYNKNIYVCMSRLYTRNNITRFDATSLVNEAETVSSVQACGGFDYINSLFSTTVIKESLPAFLQRLLENSSKKLLYDKLSVIRKTVLDSASSGSEGLNASELLNIANNHISDVLSYSSRMDDAEDFSSGIIEFVEDLREHASPIKGIQTGFPNIDTRLNGLIPGSLTIIAARPKVGKSLFLINVAKYMAYDCQIPVIYIDTEMSSNEQKTRMLSLLSGVRERSISNGTFGDDAEHCERVLKAAEIIQKGSFYHKYVPGVTPDKVVSLAKKYHIKKHIGAVFFDYIKLPDSVDLRNVKEHQLLGQITTTLKDVAGILNVPVITAAQIGRSGASKGHIKPDMIADSDRLLRYCNNMLGLCGKTKDEIAFGKESTGISDDVQYYKQYGSHRLQILETRAGGSTFEGVHLTVHKTVMHISESLLQPGTDGHNSEEEEY